jgi:uncharacterized protein YlxW (UPF0749 family)
MDNNYNGMYEANNDDALTQVTQHTGIHLQEKGMIKEMEIDGKKISVVDAAVVIKLTSDLRNFQTIIAKLTNDIRNLTTRLSNAERRFKAINAELDNKVSYD